MKRFYNALLIIIGLTSLLYGSISHSFSFENHLGEIRESVLFYCGLPTHPTPGEPQMPYKKYRFLLPPDISIESVAATLSNAQYQNFSKGVHISPAPDYVDGSETDLQSSGNSIQAKPSPIYEENAFFPVSSIYSYRVVQKRQFKMLEVVLFPFQYNPTTKEIRLLQQGTIEIEYKKKKEREPHFSIPSRYLSKIKTMVLNYDEVINSYTERSPISRNNNYHIITTKNIKNSLSKLDDFIQNKINRGFTITVVTEDEWGGGSGNSAADNLRNWLETNYLTDGIENVLLIGDPSPADGNMAMKIAHAYYSGKKAPTDFYFAELSGNWDADGDGKFGETDDLNTKKSGGIDAEADIAVGRIPFYSGDAQKVDAILEKIITYETEPASTVSWRNNILLAMDGYYGSEGPEVGEKIKSDLQAASPSWDTYRIYCSSKGSPDKNSTSMANVTNAWAPGQFGVVSWLTHGKEDAAMHIMDINYAKQLSNQYPSFVMMGSCLNGKPEIPYNLAYTILQQGGIGVIAGSETTIYKQPMGNFVGSSYNHGFIHSVSMKLSKDREWIIDALDRTRTESDLGCWKNYCAFNLYGDPTLGVDVYGVAVPVVSKCSPPTTTSHSMNNGVLTLSVEKGSSASYKLFNLKGQELISQTHRGNTVVNLKRLGFTKGFYILEITNNAITKRFKIQL